MRWEHYHVMTSVEETIQRLTEEQGHARVVAGGTDFMVDVVETGAQVESLTLLDISQIEAMRGIHESGSYIVIGAATTMTEMADSKVIQEKARALAQGAAWLGSPQIRNVATIGGNVVNAQPAADTSIPLVALGAEAHILSPEGERYEPVEALFRGVGESAINPSWELITDFRLPPYHAPRQSSAMQRLAKRKAFTLPQLLVAVGVGLSKGREEFESVRIVVAPVASTPWRARRAEEALVGTPLLREKIDKAADLAREDARPRESLRGGADYRKEMVKALTRRAFSDALSQLGKEPE